MTDYKDILEKYGDDADAIKKAMFDYMKDHQIPYVKVLDAEGDEPKLYEVYDGTHTRIVDQKVYDKIRQHDSNKDSNGLNQLAGN